MEGYLHFNFAIPLGSLVLAVLMCGHILRPSSTGVIVGFGGGLVIIGAYFILLITFRQMAISGSMSPILAAYGFNAVGLIFGVWLLQRYRPAT
jgi:lipopolysaccharide export LptBFGC system permease protein LptF